MILAVQRLKELSKTGPKLARWTIFYYLSTTLIAIGHSTALTALVWRHRFIEADAGALQVSSADAEMVADREAVAIEDVVVDMFQSFIPRNLVDAFATNALLAVLIASIVVGYLVKGPTSLIVKLSKEVEHIITVIITFLIKIAPIGVFFLILPNCLRLDIRTVGENIGMLIAASLSNMAIHIFLVMPLIYFIFVRKNPYVYWFKSSRSWITAWGTASSAATMPITIREALARGNPNIVTKFVVPLGTLVNVSIRPPDIMLVRDSGHSAQCCQLYHSYSSVHVGLNRNDTHPLSISRTGRHDSHLDQCPNYRNVWPGDRD